MPKNVTYQHSPICPDCELPRSSAVHRRHLAQDMARANRAAGITKSAVIAPRRVGGIDVAPSPVFPPLEKPAEGSPCTAAHHHWDIAPPEGPTSIGVCRHCGEARSFRNSAIDSIWEGEPLAILGRMA